MTWPSSKPPFWTASSSNAAPGTSCGLLLRQRMEKKPVTASAGASWTSFSLHILAHTGGQQGTSTAFAVVPSRNAGVVVLCNMDDVDVNQLAMQILRIALDLPESTS